MTNEVLIVRIAGLGLGDLSDSRAVALTSRPIAYGGNAKIEGVVADLADQLSSEISLFGGLGSDTTTSVSVLATKATMRMLLARGKKTVLDQYGAAVVTTDYVMPVPLSEGDTVIYVSDSTNIYVDDLIRIATTVFRVISIDSPYQITGRRYYDCAPIPIPMVRSGTGVGVEGQTVYSVNATNPSGGAESLPITISTVPVDAVSALQETVIFRGIVNKVSIETSAGSLNQIKIECGSLIAYLRAASFAPARGSVVINGYLPEEANVNNWPTETIQIGINNGFQYNPKLYGPLYPVQPAAAATVMPAIQFRSGGAGGIGSISSIADFYFGNDIYGVPQNGYLVNYVSQYIFDESGNGRAVGGYQMSFRDSYYTMRSDGPELTTRTVRWRDYSAVANPFGTDHDWRKVYDPNNPDVIGETCFQSPKLATLLIDLILGTYDADLRMLSGCRSASEAAWLPFKINNVSDIIDLASLNAFLSGFDWNDIPAWFVDGIPTSATILPYKHDEVKTVADVLEEILKRLGGFLVYDAGRLVFGRWSARPDTPTIVNDTALATPEIRLSFDRNNCVQAVNATLTTDLYGGEVTKVEIPLVNIDLGIGAQGKTISLGHFGVFGMSAEPLSLAGSGLWTNAVNYVLRYSQAAATIEVTYRDEVKDLAVGQQVSLSSAFLPNAHGNLGVTAATGIVLKAARSWRTPTTSYTILLTGYLNPINRISVVSASGVARSNVATGEVEIDANQFTNPASEAATGAPTSDAAAFAAALELSGGALPVQLLDKYGTPYGISDYLIDVTGNVLTCGLVADSANPDDIIVVDSALTIPNIAVQWDAFLADAAGQVQGQQAFAYKWVR